jgi:TRAP-type C4-dicarboxylate transport system permease small subunit
MARFLSLIDRLSRVAEIAAVALIFGYCTLMLIEVVARAQARSFSFTWEYSQYAMAAIFALASGPAIRTAVHVRISAVSDLLPERGAKWLDVVANLCALLIVAALCFAMWTKVSGSFERNILATSVSKTPLWIPQTLVLWGLTQLWLDLLARVLRRIGDQQYEWRDMKEQTDA